MGFYILIFVLAVLVMILENNIKDNKKKRVMGIGLFVMLALTAGTRFELGGSDYYVYRRCFDLVPDLWHIQNLKESIKGAQLINMFEPGFLIFNSLVKTLGFNFYGFTLIEASIWFICMYKGLKKYVEEWAIVIIVFMYKLFFYNTFISLRQSITIALFFLAIGYIQEKKWIQYYVISCFAMLFHNAAILLFILYPILQIEISKKRLVLANIFCWILYLFEKLGMSVFDIINYVLRFLDTNNTLIVKAKIWLTTTIELNMFHILEYLLLMFLVIVFYEKIIDVDENAEFIIKVFLVLLPILSICSGNIVSTRFKDFFTITYGILLMYLCRIDKGRMKWIVELGTVVVCAYGYIRYLVNFDAGGLLPYVSFISKGINIFQ